MKTQAALHQAALVADRPARHDSPLRDAAFGVLWLVPLAFMLWRVIRQRCRRAKRRMAAAVRVQGCEPFVVESGYAARLRRYEARLKCRGCVCVELLFPLALACLFIAAGLAAWIAADEIARRF